MYLLLLGTPTLRLPQHRSGVEKAALAAAAEVARPDREAGGAQNRLLLLQPLPLHDARVLLCKQTAFRVIQYTLYVIYFSTP